MHPIPPFPGNNASKQVEWGSKGSSALAILAAKATTAFKNCEELLPDRIGTDEKTHKAGVGSCGLRPVADDDPHLLAGTLEAGGNGQGGHIAIAFGLRLLDRLDLFGYLTEALTLERARCLNA